MVKKLAFYLALGLVFLSINVNAQLPDFTLRSANTDDLQIGDTLVVGVYTKNFTNVQGFSFSLNWNEDVLTFVQNVDQVNNNLPPTFASNQALVTTGVITMSWNDQFFAPQTIPDDSLIIEFVRFVAIANGDTDLTLSGMPTVATVVSTDSGETTPAFAVNETPTAVSDGMPPVDPPFMCNFTGFGLAIESDSAATGEQLCLSVNSCNWDSLTTVQYSLNFNPAILQFDSIGSIDIPQAEQLFWNSNNTDGWAVAIWGDTLNAGVDFPDTVAFDFCFTVIGAGGDMDTVRFSNSPLSIDVTDNNSNGSHIGFESIAGNVVVAGNSESAITVVGANVEGAPGDFVCVPVTVQNFNDVTTFQYTMDFDTALLVYDSIRNFNPNLPGLENDINDTPSFTDNGKLTVAYIDDGTPISLMNGDTIYEVCFTIKATAMSGDNALVGFSDDPLMRGATQTGPVPLLSNNGSVSIVVAGSGPLEFTLESRDVCPDSAFCLSLIAVDGFTGVDGGNLNLSLDPAFISFVGGASGLQNIHPNFAANNNSWIGFSPGGGTEVRLLLSDNAVPPMPTTLPPGSKVLDICFNAPANGTPSGTMTPINYLSGDIGDVNSQAIPFTFNNSVVHITDDACPQMEPEITVMETITNVDCNGGNTGSIALNIGGGDGMNYSIIWDTNPAQTTSTINNLTAGMYAVTITSGSRTFMDTYTVTQPTAALSGSTTVTDITCNGDNDGTVSLIINGGTPNYSVAWSNTAQTGQNLTGLGPNTYVPTITDMNGCTLILPGAVVTEPALLSINILNTENISCLDDNDGSITIDVMGGRETYTYQWTPGGSSTTSPNLTNATAGTYRVTVTDASMCTIISPAITLTEPATSVSITNIDITPVSCNDPNSGAIDISVNGGTPNYTYQWSASGMPVTQDIMNVPAGGYVVTITDDNTCTFTSGVIVVPTSPAIVISSSISQPNCDSEADGAIDLSVSGGTGDGFSYSWSNNAMTEDLNSLQAGNYVVTITDTGDGCVNTRSFDLANTINLNITEVSSTPAGCAGATNGSLTISVSGGNGNYTYLWNTMPAQTDESLENVTSGTYTVTVTDNPSGCLEIASFTVDSDAGIMITENSITEASCDDAENGAINISVSGAGANPSFLWSDGNMTATEDINGLAPGNYVVTVTSTDGLCTQTESFTINAGNGFTINQISITPATCDGAANGEVDINATGGQGTYTYIWSTGSVTQDIINAVGGSTATVTVTDQANCTEIAIFNITAGNGFNASVVSVDEATCNESADGNIDITVDASNPTFTWNTSPVTVTEDLTGVPAGTYSVTITDDGGCTETLLDINIPAGNGFNASVVSIDEATCNESADGNIDITVDASNPTFTWNTSPVTVTEDLTGVPAGTYSVTITDNGGCIETLLNITIDEPSALSINTIDVDNVTCNGFDDGMIEVTPQGGTPGYQYLWSNGDNTAKITGLSPNDFVVTVTDIRGCTFVSAPITITQPDAIVVAGDVTNVSNMAGDNGAITVTAVGGSNTFTNYDWTGGLTGSTITGLTPGEYTVTVTDDAGCIGINTFTVNAADAPNPTLVNTTPVTCFDGSDGTITISVTGGDGMYSYDWSDLTIGDTPTAVGLTADTYSVTVTDGAGIEGVLTGIIITQPSQMIGYTLDASTNPTCPGDSNGSISITPTGGNDASFTVEWDNEVGIVEDPINLAAGTYTPTITDAEGCIQVSDPVTIVDPTAISLLQIDVTDITCNGDDDGMIEVTPQGGTPGYDYEWSNGGNTAKIMDLPAGAYIVTVTDLGGCTFVSSPIGISEPDAIVVTGNITNVSGAGNDGAIAVNAVGGSDNFVNYEWNPATLMGDNPTGLTPDTYLVTVTDDNGCTGEASFTINDADAPIPTADNVTAVTCFGGSDGSITISVTGGDGNNTYTWTGPTMIGDTPTAVGLTAGTYNLTVTDGANITGVLSNIVVTQPDMIDYSVLVTTVTCPGGTDGAIDLTPTGGNGPNFIVEWDNGIGTIEDPIGLAAGSYTPTITDSRGCTQVGEPIVVSEPDPLTVDLVNLVNPSCEGNVQGSIEVSVSGGNVPYTNYTWAINGTVNDDLASSPFINNLVPGTYTLTVTDNLGCTVAAGPYEISGLDAIIIDLVSTMDVTCAGIANGAIDVTVTGGLQPYSFAWKNGLNDTINTGMDLMGLIGGNYTFCVLDANGCTESIGPITVFEPQPITFLEIQVDNASATADDGEIRIIGVQGGVGPYTYMWEGPNGEMFNTGNTARLENVNPGLWEVIITDSNGCTLLEQGILVEGRIAIDPTITDPQCAGGDGSIFLEVINGAAPFEFDWATTDGSGIVNGAQNQTNLTAGTYSVTLVDANGVQISDTYTLMDPEPINITFQITNETGAGCNGVIDAMISGGTPPYTYQWNNGANAQDLFNVCKGQYELTVIDANGCIALSAPQFVTAGPLQTASVSFDDVTCNGNNDGSATIEVFGGCDPYTFTISSGQVINSTTGMASFTGLMPGNYMIVVTDVANSVPLDFNFTIGETPGVVLDDVFITDNTSTDPQNCNGAVNITLSGGQLPYTYQWSNGEDSQDISGVCAEESPLSVVVIDANGCIKEFGPFILEDGIRITLNATNESCFGDQDGSIIATVAGGNPPYIFNWSNGTTTPNITELAPGSYTLTVTDAGGATETASATINGSNSAINVTATITVPTGISSDGAIDLMVTGGAGGFTYLWISNGIVISSAQDIAGLSSGNYTVIITDQFDCVFSETYNLAGLEIMLTFQAGNTGCAGQGDDRGTLEVFASGGNGGPYTYLWNNGQNNSIIGGLSAGDYTVTVSDNSGLTSSGTGTVVPLEAINVALDIDEINMAIITSVTGGTTPYSYRWNDENQSTTTNLNNVIAGENYSIVVSDVNGCTGVATINVLFGPCENVSRVLTPNGDTKNEVLEVACAENFDIELEIFNRWGQMVFAAQNYDSTWNGRDADGQLLPEGGYLYVIRYQDDQGQTQQVKGSFNILY